MTTLAEGIAQMKAEIAEAEARLAATTGNDVGAVRYREWLVDQLVRMRRDLQASEASLSPSPGTV